MTMYQGKRLRFRCNRWIRVGQPIRSFNGGEATIQRIDSEGIEYGSGDWSCAIPWSCIWKSHGYALAFVKAWRPA